jgi:hypothetical protein
MGFSKSSPVLLQSSSSDEEHLMDSLQKQKNPEHDNVGISSDTAKYVSSRVCKQSQSEQEAQDDRLAKLAASGKRRKKMSKVA